MEPEIPPSNKWSFGERIFGMVCSIGVLSVVSCVGISYYPFDADGDGVADKLDDCKSTPGVAKVTVGNRIFKGCPDPDPDVDGFYVAIPGGLNGGLIEIAVDECPDKAGTDIALNGCPSPTPEELALKAWLRFEKICNLETGEWCSDAQQLFDALPEPERTAERQAKIHPAEQADLVDNLVRSHESFGTNIPRAEETLGKIEDQAKREEARVAFARRLWVSYYYDCEVETGVCNGWNKGDDDEHHIPMTRAEAYDKLVAFYNPDKAYPEPEVLVQDLNEVTYDDGQAALLAAKEWGLDEARVRSLYANKEGNISCNNSLFFSEAAKYGWLTSDAIKCVREAEENWRFQTAIAFARSARLEAEAIRVERKLVEESLKRGVYQVTANGEKIIAVEDREEWKGS